MEVPIWRAIGYDYLPNESGPYLTMLRFMEAIGRVCEDGYALLSPGEMSQAGDEYLEFWGGGKEHYTSWSAFELIDVTTLDLYKSCSFVLNEQHNKFETAYCFELSGVRAFAGWRLPPWIDDKPIQSNWKLVRRKVA